MDPWPTLVVEVPADEAEDAADAADAADDVGVPAAGPNAAGRGMAVTVDAKINSKLALAFDVPYASLRVDALVNRTDEWLGDATGLSKEIFALAGPMLREECAFKVEQGACQTGEAVLTRGCELPASHV